MNVQASQDSDTSQALTYEEASRRLEDLVEQLSAGGLSLEESLRCFEQGMALANYCSNLLDSAELRVQQVNNLPPEELAALLERPQQASTPAPESKPEPPAPTAGASARREDPAARPEPGRRDESQPPRAQPPAGQQSGARQQGNGRRLPPTTGPQRRPPPEELDALFDEI